MRRSCVLVFFVVNFSICYAQVGEWVWLHGSNLPNSAGTYGTQGTPSAANDPPANYEPAEWTDNNGDFWFYGGLGPNNTQTYNDLWKYDPTTNEWTWMNGTATPGDPGVYGTKGVPAATNRPPALGFAASTWVDNNGNFWIFGGYNTGNDWYYSDLWEYVISTNEWTWMNGPGTMDPVGVYGTQGTAAAANYPRCRTECASNWTDKSNNLWLFGAGDGALGYNDLWKYTIATNEWTWMKGSTTSDQASVYGTQGVEAAANTPGGRESHSRWTDLNGNIYLFGGAVDVDSNFNDLWRYNPTTDNWAWMDGKDTPNDSGFYGTKCVTTASNLPWSRYENRAAWTDPDGNFWMFGGFFYISFPTVSYSFNDLWMYCVTSNEWTWESGDSTVNQSGSYGTEGTASATNLPSARGGAAGWTDGKWHLYMFGGTDYPLSNHYNDMWEYTIDTTCGTHCLSIPLAIPVANFESSDTTFCPGNCISFTDLTTGNPTSWSWSFPGAIPSSSTLQNPGSICYAAAGTYTVTLTATNEWGSDTDKKSDFITVLTSPPAPTISWSDDTLYSSTNVAYISYQWYKNNVTDTGQTNSWVYIGTDTSTYKVVVTASNGCTSTGSIDARGLPIELLTFDAAYNGKTVDLNWSTASETNNDFFTLERTKDGIGFLPIVKVKGAGTSTRLLYYHAVDDNPLFGVSAYRLKQTDFDGNYHYSGLVAVTIQSNYTLEILALNNSVTENAVQYFISSPAGKPFYIEISDRIGRVLVSKVTAESIGTIDFSGYAHGIYLFRVFDGYGSAVKKFIY